MSVAANAIKKKYDCDNSTVNWPITFQFQINSQILVKHYDDGTGLFTDLILDDAGADGFSIVSGEVVTVTIYPTNDMIWIIRETARTQTTVRKNNRRTPASVDDGSFDKTTMIGQENSEALDRSLKFAITDLSGIDPELPDPVAGRAFKVSDDGLSMVLTDYDPDEGAASAAASAAAASVSEINAAASEVAAEAAADSVLDVLTIDGANTGIGTDSLGSVTSGTRLSAFGYKAMEDATSAVDCSAFGSYAGQKIIDAIGTTFNGASCGKACTTGDWNTGGGAYSLTALTDGTNNTAYGANSLGSLVGGFFNTAFGEQAGRNATGTANLYLGYKAGFNHTGNGEMFIGNGSDGGTFANTWLYGDASHNVYFKAGFPILKKFTPATAGAQGIEGQFCFDDDYLYQCTATNTWKRVAISTW